MAFVKLPNLAPRHIELLAFVKDSWFKLALSAVCSGVEAGMTALSAYLVKPVVEKIFEQKNAQMLVLIPLAVIAVFVIKGIAAYGSYYLLNHVGQSVILRLRNRLYSYMQDLPLAFFQREKTGDLMSRITNDVGIISSMFTSAITGPAPGMFCHHRIAVRHFLSDSQTGRLCLHRFAACRLPDLLFRAQDPAGTIRGPGGHG